MNCRIVIDGLRHQFIRPRTAWKIHVNANKDEQDRKNKQYTESDKDRKIYGDSKRER